jgi:hypothetical protein
MHPTPSSQYSNQSRFDHYYGKGSKSKQTPKVSLNSDRQKSISKSSSFDTSTSSSSLNKNINNRFSEICQSSVTRLESAYAAGKCLLNSFENVNPPSTNTAASIETSMR